MRNVLHLCPKRAVAVVAAAAVMLAAVIGAYGHASSHGHERHALQALDCASGHDHDGAPGESAPSGHDHGACLDTICHGGQAVVAVVIMAIPVRPPVPFAKWASALHGAPPLPLDRPPRSAVLA